MSVSSPRHTNLILEGTATTHQANCKYGNFAGAQCVSVCSAYLLYSYYNNQTPISLTQQLDEILLLGSNIDAFQRTNGYLQMDEFAQLSNVPSFVREIGGGR